MEQIGTLNKFLLSLMAVLIISCAPEEQKGNAKKKAPKKVSVERPNFNADSAYNYVQQQVEFGPRVPNTEAHRKTAKYLSEKLQKFGFKVTNQEANVNAFDNSILRINNIIGSFNPEKNNRIMLMAHWDSRPFADQDTERVDEPIDGANDGASGVGVLLEVARQLQKYQPNIGVDIFFFDAEDYGPPNGDMRRRKPGTWCLGSQYWANNKHKADYSANYGILLDMVGAKNALFKKESISLYYAPQIVDKVWNIAAAIGHNNHFIFDRTQHVGEDDHLYINKIANIPSIDIIQYDPEQEGFAAHWHTHNDNMDVIDRETLAAVGETVLATILQEAK